MRLEHASCRLLAIESTLSEWHLISYVLFTCFSIFSGVQDFTTASLLRDSQRVALVFTVPCCWKLPVGSIAVPNPEEPDESRGVGQS